MQHDPCIQFVDFHRGGMYPHTGSKSDEHRNVINVVFAEKYTYADVEREWEAQAKQAIKKFQPNLIIICAGFDAHKNDPMRGANLTAADFGTWTRAIMSLAASLESCHGRIISLLEGGYDTRKKTNGLGRSVEEHLKALVERVNSIQVCVPSTSSSLVAC